jgi:hypothetical protein
MDTILSINAVLAGLALIYGLYSRGLGTAIGTGFMLALLHTGMIVLAMTQSGAGLTEAPYLGQLLDTFMQSGYAGFAHSRTVAYFAGTAAILLLITIVAFIFSSIVSGLVHLVVPRKASA